jgi:hypothetical protein
MERTLITLTPANVITVSLCALLGYGLLVGANMLYKNMTGN